LTSPRSRGGACGPAEGEADADHRVGVPGDLRHRTGVLEGVAQRLLAQHVLAGSDQTFRDLAVQGIGHCHTDDVDVGILRDRLPAGVRPLVPKAGCRERAKLGTNIAD
jgi:hypothetical protein